MSGTTTIRRMAAVAVLGIGTAMLLLFGGGQVAACLGPLDVTAVRCAAATGLLPTQGNWGQLLVALVAASVLVVAPHRPGLLLPSILAAAVGALTGGALYLLTRPVALEGPDYDGTWLSIPLPMEPATLAASALAGALVAIVLVRLAASQMGRRVARPA